jgi:ribose 5-phosphate isomerase A
LIAMSTGEYKRQAAERALEFVEPGMRVGLGTGSTARHFVELLGARVRSGLDVVCVPTSETTRTQAASLAIPLTTLDETPELDLTVDGADEFDDKLRLIKGGGGALLREKIVAAASRRMIVIADATKRVRELGGYPLPVEVVRFGYTATRALIELRAVEAGCFGRLQLRIGSDGQPFVTDGGNYIFDCAFGRIGQPETLAAALQSIPGVVEHGLFLDLADTAIVAGPAGIEVISSDRRGYRTA